MSYLFQGSIVKENANFFGIDETSPWLSLNRCLGSQLVCPVIDSGGQLPNYRSQGMKFSCREVPVYGNGMAVHPFVVSYCYSNVLEDSSKLYLKEKATART